MRCRWTRDQTSKGGLFIARQPGIILSVFRRCQEENLPAGERQKEWGVGRVRFYKQATPTGFGPRVEPGKFHARENMPVTPIIVALKVSAPGRGTMVMSGMAMTALMISNDANQRARGVGPPHVSDRPIAGFAAFALLRRVHMLAKFRDYLASRRPDAVETF